MVGLTTVHQPLEAMGKTAAQTLLRSHRAPPTAMCRAARSSTYVWWSAPPRGARPRATDQSLAGVPTSGPTREGAYGDPLDRGVPSPSPRSCTSGRGRRSGCAWHSRRWARPSANSNGSWHARCSSCSTRSVSLTSAGGRSRRTRARRIVSRSRPARRAVRKAAGARCVRAGHHRVLRHSQPPRTLPPLTRRVREAALASGSLSSAEWSPNRPCSNWNSGSTSASSGCPCGTPASPRGPSPSNPSARSCRWGTRSPRRTRWFCGPRRRAVRRRAPAPRVGLPGGPAQGPVSPPGSGPP